MGGPKKRIGRCVGSDTYAGTSTVDMPNTAKHAKKEPNFRIDYFSRADTARDTIPGYRVRTDDQKVIITLHDPQYATPNLAAFSNAVKLLAENSDHIGVLLDYLVELNSDGLQTLNRLIRAVPSVFDKDAIVTRVLNERNAYIEASTRFTLLLEYKS